MIPNHEDYDIDPDVLMPYGMGFDHDIRIIKNEKTSARKEAKIAALLEKLGYQDMSSFWNAVRKVDITKEKKEIREQLYAKSNKTGQKPYQDFHKERFPQSKQDPTFKGYFSEDVEDNEGSYVAKRTLELDWKVFKKTGIDPEMDQPIDQDENEDFEQSEPTYRPGAHMIPEWIITEYRKVRLKAQKGTYSTHYSRAQKEKEAGFVNPFKKYEYQGRLETEDYKAQMENFEPRIPTLKSIMQQAEEDLETKYPKFHRQSKRDEYENNENFKPRYLNQDFNQESFDWSFTSKLPDSIIPQSFYGEISPDISAEALIRATDAAGNIHASGYEPKEENKTAVRIYSMVKEDSFYDHFLKNQIRYWAENLQTNTHLIRERNVRSKRVKTVIPWEYMITSKFEPVEIINKFDPILSKEGKAVAYGRRKRAKAMAYLYPGTGKITVNSISMAEYFPDMVCRDRLIRPFKATDSMCEFDVDVNVHGGGIMGQSDACKLAIAHAMAKYEPRMKEFLREFGLLKRDIREVERKKTSMYKARKAYPWVKR